MGYINLLRRIISVLRGQFKIAHQKKLCVQPVFNSNNAVFDRSDLGAWYNSPVMLGPSTLGALATSAVCLRQVIKILKPLEPDDYVRYLLAYYQTGLERFGNIWRYADILTVLLAVAQLVQPLSYLEIGVRRGRSMAVVAATCPECDIVGLDLWISNYADMSNPGPEFARGEIKKVGHTGRLELIGGDSHKVLPYYFKEHPDAFFDLITVDGDHSRQGAEQDLQDVLPRLKVGGVVVFDDVCHPAHPYLLDVWQQIVEANSCFSTWQFTELGYGVALAVRVEA